MILRSQPATYIQGVVHHVYLTPEQKPSRLLNKSEISLSWMFTWGNIVPPEHLMAKVFLAGWIRKLHQYSIYAANNPLNSPY